MAHRQMSDANFNSGGIIFALSLHCPDQAAAKMYFDYDFD